MKARPYLEYSTKQSQAQPSSTKTAKGPSEPFLPLFLHPASQQLPQMTRHCPHFFSNAQWVLRLFFHNTFSPSLTFVLRKLPPGTMQSLEYQVFCQTCREITYREVRYRSDFQFVGRLLVCQNRGETILEPVGSATVCQDC